MYFTLDEKGRICVVTGGFDEFGEPCEFTRTLSVQEAKMLKQQLAIILEEVGNARRSK